MNATIVSIESLCSSAREVVVSWYCDRAVALPAFWIDMVHDGTTELDLVSLLVGADEQLSVKPIPAGLFAMEDVPRFHMPTMHAGDRMQLRFRTTRAAPESFTVWFGERSDVQKKADEIGVKPPF